MEHGQSSHEINHRVNWKFRNNIRRQNVRGSQTMQGRCTFDNDRMGKEMSCTRN